MVCFGALLEVLDVDPTHFILYWYDQWELLSLELIIIFILLEVDCFHTKRTPKYLYSRTKSSN